MEPPEAVVLIMQVILACSALVVTGLIVWLTTVIVRQNLAERRAELAEGTGSRS